MDGLMQLWASTGISNFQADQAVMMSVGFGLLYLAIKKEFEPLLLLPIGFGAVLSNIPVAGIASEGGLLAYLYLGIKSGLFPLLIFMGVSVGAVLVALYLPILSLTTTVSDGYGF